MRDLKATVDGELDVAGPELAAAVATTRIDVELITKLIPGGDAVDEQASLRQRSATLSWCRELRVSGCLADTPEQSGGSSL